MWEKGTLEIEGKTISYEVKYYDAPSEFGIEGGRISKMELRIGSNVTLRYDRGWDIEPEDYFSQLAYAVLLNQYR